MKYKIITGKYETGTEEQQAGYKMLLGEDNIKYKFDLYFHWYNIAHELGHCVLDKHNVEMSKVQEEMFVNEFAVSYWLSVGQSERIKELEKMLEETLARIESPVPQGTEFTDYFEGIWGSELLNSVMLYGYFQLRSVLETIKSHREFGKLLSSINISIAPGAELLKYDGSICAENACNVLNNVLCNIRNTGIADIEAEVELIDNPMVQCAQTI